jgi:hypothetical protein
MTVHMNCIYFFNPVVYHVLKAYFLRAINTRIDYENNVKMFDVRFVYILPQILICRDHDQVVYEY